MVSPMINPNTFSQPDDVSKLISGKRWLIYQTLIYEKIDFANPSSHVSIHLSNTLIRTYATCSTVGN